MALRYLNEGNGTIPEFRIPIPDAINAINRIPELRIFARSLLNY